MLGAKMMRPDVALVSPYPPPGSTHAGRSGVASYASNLARSLAREGAAVTVIAAAENGREALSIDGPVRVERRFRRGPGAVPAATGAAAATGAPVVHLQHELFLYGGADSVPGLAAALGALRARRPRTVVTMHQVVDPRSVDSAFTRLHRVPVPAWIARAGLAGVQRTIRRLADRVVVHEAPFARLVPGAAVVPHGIETAPAPARDESRERLGLDDRFTALCFGFVAPYKGIERALEAAALLDGSAQLVVAGAEHPRLAAGAPYAGELRRRFGATARFTGRVEDADVSRWFAAADVALFLYPRPFASSGALALALAHGTPPLLSPQLADLLGAPRALAVPLEPGRLAANLADLAARPDRLESMRAACRELGAGRSWRAVARRHLALYEEVIGADGASRRSLRST
jgi:glycosyltransferase involved in cell wall biosynthesis